MLKFFVDNKTIFFEVLIVMVPIAILCAYRLYKKARLDRIREEVIFYYAEAERRYRQNGQEAERMAYVADRVYDRLPKLLRVSISRRHLQKILIIWLEEMS